MGRGKTLVRDSKCVKVCGVGLGGGGVQGKGLYWKGGDPEKGGSKIKRPIFTTGGRCVAGDLGGKFITGQSKQEKRTFLPKKGYREGKSTRSEGKNLLSAWGVCLKADQFGKESENIEGLGNSTRVTGKGLGNESVGEVLPFRCGKKAKRMSCR